MKTFTIYFRHVNNSPLNLPGSKSFDNDLHEKTVQATKSTVAEKRLVTEQKSQFNRTIKIIRTIEEKS